MTSEGSRGIRQETAHRLRHYCLAHVHNVLHVRVWLIMASQSLGTATLRPGSARKLRKLSERGRVSMDLPERFRMDDEDEEDGGRVDEDNPETYVQQSMYGIIAAAHSRANFKSTLQPFSGSESESEGEGSRRNSKDMSRFVSEDSSERSSLDEKQAHPSRADTSRHRKNKMSESLRSYLKPIRERSDSLSQDPDTFTVLAAKGTCFPGNRKTGHSNTS